MDEIVAILKTHPTIDVLIEGYADSGGGVDQLVARLRAASVRDRLVEKGIALSRVSIKGYGVREAICLADRSACAKQSRRVHFVIPFPEGVAEDLLFNEDQWEMPSSEKINKMAQWLIAHPETDIVIEGYADDEGYAGLDRLVAKLRAASVRDRLVEKGVAWSRLSVTGYGVRDWLCSADKAGCAKQSRRVHFVRKVPRVVMLPPVETVALPTPEGALPPKPVVYYDLLLAKTAQFLNLGKMDEAGRTLAVVLAAYPDDARANYLMGIIKEREGQLDVSEAAYRAAIKQDPMLIDAYLSLATFYYDRQAFDKMLNVLASAEPLAPDNGFVVFHQARAYQGLIQDESAAPRFLRAALLEPSVAIASHYYAGISFYRLGLYEDAQEAFRVVLEDGPDSGFAGLAKKRIKETKKAERKGRRWSLFLNASLQYDNNVLLEPSDGPLAGQTAGGSGDGRAVVYTKGDYFFPVEEVWKVGTSYTLYQSLHQTLTRFNTQSHTPALYIAHKDGANEARFDYQYDVVFLDEERYLKTQTLRPAYTYTPRPTFSSQFYYQIQSKDFLESPTFPVNSERDGSNNQIGLSTRISFGGFLAKVGYAFEREDAEGPDWDLTGHHVTVGTDVLFPMDVRGQLGAGYSLKDYSNPNSFSQGGQVREDSVYTTNLRLTRTLTPQSDLSFNHSFTRNDSNLPVFDYTRHISSLNYGWRF